VERLLQLEIVFTACVKGLCYIILLFSAKALSLLSKQPDLFVIRNNHNMILRYRHSCYVSKHWEILRIRIVTPLRNRLSPVTVKEVMMYKCHLERRQKESLNLFENGDAMVLESERAWGNPHYLKE
jgi:hypothetical protein